MAEDRFAVCVQTGDRFAVEDKLLYAVNEQAVKLCPF